MRRLLAFGTAWVIAVVAGGCGDDETITTAATTGGGGTDPCIDTGEHPIPRAETMGIVDPTRQRAVFFGGDTGVPQNCNPSPQPIGEMWTFDLRCNQFEQADLQGGPSPRARGVAVYDPDGDRMIIFGGRYRTAPMMPYTLFNDVWALDLETLAWSQIATTGTPPSARSSTAAAYDPLQKQLLVFGGNESADGLNFIPKNDLWALDLATGAWRTIAPVGTPPVVRLFHSATLDPATGRFYVYGGGGTNALMGPFLGDLWSVDPSTGAWTEEHNGTMGAPAPRIHSGIFFDPGSGRLLLFAGHDDGSVGNQNDTWSFDPASKTWTTIVPPEQIVTPAPQFCLFPPDFTAPNMTAPDRRSAYLGALDQANGRIFVYGGKTDCGNIDDVWTFDLATNTWTRQVEATIGEACVRGDHPEQCTTLCI
jgi:galactose oxidase-like protein